jgi:diguanylate cyclase (GGDEF)-like protein
MSSAVAVPGGWIAALVVFVILGAVILLMAGRQRKLAARERTVQALLEERSQQLEKANRALRELTAGDPLTGIANHRTFQEDLRKQWRRTARSRLPLTLLMIDVDGLRHFNESKGHQAGDECLRQVADVLRRQLQRPGDAVGRYGGDEFVVLLAETDASGGLAVAERMRRAIEDLDLRWGPDAEKERITISVGAATTIPSPQENATSLVAAADRALAVAKRNGRNRVEM